MIVPSVVLNVRPAGNAGEMDQEVTAPPVEAGVRVAVGSPTASATRPLGYLAAGATSLTDMTRLAVALPPLFVAVSVYVACAVTAVAVPVIEPEVVLRVSPDGNAGVTE